MDIIESVVSRTGLPAAGVRAVVELLDDGATVPFISRYRKERTGSLDEVAVRSIEESLHQVRELRARQQTVIHAIEEAGKLTDQLRDRILSATTMTQVEDLYAPFRRSKRTRAAIAREKGLEPLARKIMSGHLPASASDDDVAGASDIIAEWASESTRLRNAVRRSLRRDASLVCTPAKGMDDTLARSALAQYGSFSKPVRHVASHQYLALRRAEREGLIKVKYNLDKGDDRLIESLQHLFVPQRCSGECARVIAAAVDDAYRRLLRPSVENEISAELKAEADRVAIDIFSTNLRQLLLAAPLKGRRILAIDPGYRTGCKVVALDSSGTLLDEAVIYPAPPRSDFEGAEATLCRLITRHRLDTIALGSGTASRDTEQFLLRRDIMPRQAIFVVSEDGASVYSASETARREFPDHDVTVRGAVSIGRRLIDPLAELVKIDPKAIGVGQYQHDVDQAALKDALDFTVLSCVNAVGVELNTASEQLLAYVSGIGPTLAANIVQYRTDNGPFRSRTDLFKVSRLGPKAFEQSAGFLRIADGREPLDNTGIHPESYSAVTAMAESLNVGVDRLIANDELLDRVDIDALAASGVAGQQTLADIVAELRKPGRDPRGDASKAFTPAVSAYEQLSVGMTVPCIVTNITAFGAFVNLGIKEQGLIHISRMATRRIDSATDILSLGQQIEARIIALDPDRRRISLSLI
ncbi:MAG: RNA-binding transcriptional accessory protein [Bacteroides sp.]|nr:RNA-binding transcriptional accessory protein [Bacteroides sp.]MCM1414222.1 RNA-binding transcriptional accessory protein [Bacteroides sp.]MCM1471785.1 RNA-binding transcriptional accessory protein [Bacteroides sp.]